MKYELFYDKERTKTITSIVWDEKTNKCAIIDSVLDYNQNSGRTFFQSADALIEFIKSKNLTLEWILETHIHADHLTASDYIQKKLGGKKGIGSKIKEVIAFWKEIFEDEEMKTDGSNFDKLFEDGEEFSIGSLKVKAIHTPGHTPACLIYKVEDFIFAGDTIFSPNVGTARTDFPGGSSEALYNSIQKLFKLPDETKIVVGHDYPKEGESPMLITTIKEEKAKNIMLNELTSKEEFVAKREERQKNLPIPTLLLPSLHVNLRAGLLPKFIKIPVNKF